MYDEKTLTCHEDEALVSQEPARAAQPGDRSMESLVSARQRSGLAGPQMAQQIACSLDREDCREENQEVMAALYAIQRRAAAYGFDHEVSPDTAQIHITSPRGLRRAFLPSQRREANEWMLAESRLADGPSISAERNPGKPYDPGAKARQIKSDLSLLIANPGANVAFTGAHAYGELSGKDLSLEAKMQAARVGGAAFDVLTGPVQAAAMRRASPAGAGGGALSHPVHPDHHLDKAPDADLVSGQPAIPRGAFNAVPPLSVEAAPRDLDDEQD